MSTDTTGFLAGCIIIGLSCIVIALFSNGADWAGFPDDWETLVVGVLAVFAAVWTIRQTRAQIRQAADHRQDDLARQDNSARAVLPLALSSISDYATECVKVFLPMVQSADGRAVRAGIVIPSIPAELLPALRDCIRFADGGKRDELSVLLRWLQIQSARLRSVKSENWIITMDGAATYIVDAVELNARASALFPYARSEMEDRAVNELITLARAARQCGVYLDSAEIKKKLADREDAFRAELMSYDPTRFRSSRPLSA